MQLLVGIHLHEIHKKRLFAKFVKERFAADKNSFFVLFYWPHFSKKNLDSLIKRAGLPPERFFVLKAQFRRDGWETHFGPYGLDFNEAISTISKKLGREEKVKVFSFGGATLPCYYVISLGLVEALKKRFGERVVKVASVPQWIYSRKGKRKLPLPKKRSKLRQMAAGIAKRIAGRPGK